MPARWVEGMALSSCNSGDFFMHLKRFPTKAAAQKDPIDPRVGVEVGLGVGQINLELFCQHIAPSTPGLLLLASTMHHNNDQERLPGRGLR